MSKRMFTPIFLVLIAAAGVLQSGCDSTPTQSEAEGQPTAAASHNHMGWWCVEHGVPEEVCTRCSPKLAPEFQAKGDWCEEHGLPDSQCFVHHPELKAKFAAQFKAKFGEEPPAPAE
jgi:hypothetical protein